MPEDRDIHPEDDAAEWAGVRATAYGLLAECLARPTPALTARLLDGSVPRAFALLAAEVGATADRGDLAGLRDRLAELDRWVTDLDGRSPAEVLAELEPVYNRLFVGPGHLLAPPYESVYFTASDEVPQGHVMGDAAGDAAEQYRAAGLEIRDDLADLPDHIAAELAFMAYLCGDEAAHLSGAPSSVPGDGPERQRQFLTSHLGRWAGLLAGRVHDAGLSPFYGAVAALAAAWVALDLSGL